MPKRKWCMVSLLLCAALAGCGDAPINAQRHETPVTHLSLASEQRAALASRRIFFGHQSVGGNVVAGVRELLGEDTTLRLSVVHTDKPWTVEGPAFIESEIGINGDPASKSRAFSAAVARGLDRPGAIALHKYCYIDVSTDTDPDALFADYRRTMRELKQRHPLIRFVHVTMPLTANVEPPAKLFVKRLLGRPTELALNQKRNRYNQLLRTEYSGREPVFDLATLESTHADGSRAFVTFGGERVYVLASEHTTDGGHLTRAAQRLIGERLLEFLAAVPMPAQTLADVQ